MGLRGRGREPNGVPNSGNLGVPASAVGKANWLPVGSTWERDDHKETKPVSELRRGHFHAPIRAGPQITLKPCRHGGSSWLCRVPWLPRHSGGGPQGGRPSPAVAWVPL